MKYERFRLGTYSNKKMLLKKIIVKYFHNDKLTYNLSALSNKYNISYCLLYSVYRRIKMGQKIY